MGNKFVFIEHDVITLKTIKMKNIIYLCLFAVVALNYNCSKDEVQLDAESTFDAKSTNITSKKQLNQVEGLDKSSLPGEDLNVQSSSIGSSNNDAVYILYINMDLMEQEYNSDSSNPSYTGPFNLYFRNVMSNQFTIYNINVSTNFACGNIERWYVNLEELNTYLLSIGEYTVSNGNGQNNDNPGGNTTGGGSSNTNGTTGINGGRGKGKVLPDDDEPTGILLLNYSYCFS